VPRQVTFYNPEKETQEMYTEVFQLATVIVKDVSNLAVWHHYWRDAEGELWSDFTDSSENLRRDFQAYRERRHFLSSDEIMAIRQLARLSPQEFANTLGLSTQLLSELENNQRVQTADQDQLFRQFRK